MDFSDYSQHDATGLAELVATKQVTPAELLAAARARAADVNNKIGAIVRTLPEADQQVQGDLTGPFAGVPFLIKDLGQDYKGHPTSGGCRALSTLPAPEHSTIVRRWLDAGLVIFGKTNTPEFGSKGITEPELFGASRNPWDLGRTPGGSSGGSA
ncbi:amidase family protein, partial [Mycobacteroides abscessus]